MANISKAHKRFSESLSELLNNPKVLTNPKEFLGPNCEAVLNFWLILDGLSEDQWKTIDKRYRDFRDNRRSEWEKAADEAFEASNETIGSEFANNAACVVYGYAAGWATRELIGMHKFFEQQKPLIFFNMFLEVL